MVWLDNYSVEVSETHQKPLKCEIEVFLGLVHYRRCENLSILGLFGVIWGSYFAIIGLWSIGIMGCGLFCGLWWLDIWVFGCCGIEIMGSGCGGIEIKDFWLYGCPFPCQYL